MGFPFQASTRGVKRSIADVGLISRGSIAFTSGNDLTTEKKTSAISLPSGLNNVHVDGLYYLQIDKPTENTAGDLTIKVYNVSTVDGTNARDLIVNTHTVEKITSAGTYRQFEGSGIFVGDASIKLSATFATDSGAITVYYALYRA